jgi:hypothetical protein
VDFDLWVFKNVNSVVALFVIMMYVFPPRPRAPAGTIIDSYMPKDVNVLKAVRNDPWGRAEHFDGAEFSNSRFQKTVIIFLRAPRVSCVFV